MAVSYKSIAQFKSSLYDIARSAIKSRTRLSERVADLTRENQQLRATNEKQAEQISAAKRQQQELRFVTESQQKEIDELRSRKTRLPAEPVVPGHQYGPKMICLCLMLVQKLGFRASEAALQIVFDFLQIEDKVPSHDSMRTWACRVGLAVVQNHEGAGDDEIWFSDHSNQIGAEKVFSVLAIRESELPPVGQTLSRSKLRPIHVAVAKNWKTQDVREHYKALAEKRGHPKTLVTDGANELRDSADVLEKPGKKLLILRDLKHKAANIFEQLIGNSERFKEYQSKLGRTRSQIQQTELSHFTPPKQKPKARFMNLGPILKWGRMISFHLDSKDTRSRKGLTDARMEEKLGWVREFQADLHCWSQCEQVMGECLSFIGKSGVSAGIAAKMQESIESSFSDWCSVNAVAKTMSTRLFEFIESIESELAEGQRVWVLTDNLESSFGAFKQLEGQHSKSGFTGLVAAMPMLLTDLTPELVRESLESVSVKQMRTWVKANLGETLASKRNLAHAEYRKSLTG